MTTPSVPPALEATLDDIGALYADSATARTDCHPVATERGLSVLSAAGTTRDVYTHPDLPDCVIKFDRHTRGPRQNQREVDVFETYGETGLFAPIYAVATDRRWLVMQRVEPTNEPAAYRAFKQARDNAGIHVKDFVMNIGYYDDRVVMYDYAYPNGVQEK
jgi:hypothetical protein